MDETLFSVKTLTLVVVAYFMVYLSDRIYDKVKGSSLKGKVLFGVIGVGGLAIVWAPAREYLWSQQSGGGTLLAVAVWLVINIQAFRITRHIIKAFRCTPTAYNVSDWINTKGIPMMSTDERIAYTAKAIPGCLVHDINLDEILAKSFDDSWLKTDTAFDTHKLLNNLSRTSTKLIEKEK